MDREFYEAMNFAPWLTDGLVARPEAGWTPTPGCKACDEESSGLKRRGDRSITSQNAQRSKLFSVNGFADDAPLVMELVAGLVLPWLGTSETAAASSSSSGVLILQPMAVELDVTVRRGLKRATDGGDMENEEFCSLISDVNDNEEPHPQVLVMEFCDEEERQALWSELVRLDEFEAKNDIPGDQAFADFHVGSHSEERSTKLSVVSAPLWSTIRKEQGVVQLLHHKFTKCCLFWLLTTGWSVRFFSWALAHTHRGVWEMTKTGYGLEEAPTDFDEHCGKVGEDLCDESGFLGSVRLTTEPAAFHS